MARRFVLVFLLVGGPLLLAVHLFVSQALDRAEAQAGERTLAVARLGAYAVGEYIGGLVHYAEAYARRVFLREAFRRRDEEGVRSALEEMVRSNPRVDRAFAADPSGVEWSDFPHDPAVIGQGFSHRDWYRGVMGSEDSYVSHVYRRAAGRQEAVTAVAVPVKDGDRMLGILVVQVLVGSLEVALRSAVGTWNGSLFLLDREGRVALTAAGHGGEPAFPRWDEDAEKAPRPPRRPAESWLMASAPVPSFSGTLLAERRRSVALAGAEHWARGVTTASAVAALLLSILASASLERRRQRLRAAGLEEQRRGEIHRRKSEFLEYLVQQLLVPLDGVEGTAELLLDEREEALPRRVRERLKILLERARSLRALIRELLDSSRIEEARLEAQPEIFDLEALAGRVVEAFEPLFWQRGIALTLSVDACSSPVLADPRHAEQALAGLLSRALHLSCPTEVSVRIRHAGGSRALEVVDDGEGPEPKGQAGTGAQGAGAEGPGLFLCRRLVELQGGQFRVARAPGGGTQVCFTLPKASAAAPGAEPAALEPAGASASPSSPRAPQPR